jgi:hypothetical protein
LRHLFLLLVVITAFSGCKPIRYSDPKITRIAIRDFEATESFNITVSIEGPDTYYEVTGLATPNAEIKLEFLDLSLAKEGKDYTMTLYRQVGTSLEFMTDVTFDLGDYRGQANINIDGDSDWVVSMSWDKLF